MNGRRPDVSVVIVTYNSVEHLPRLAAALRRQRGVRLEVTAVDNGSADGSDSRLEMEFPGVRIIRSDRNRGYSWGCNRGIEASRGRYVFLLNPDTDLADDCLAQAVNAADADPRVGIIAPRIYRLSLDGARTRIFDSTGIYCRPDGRHLDRGSGEEDRGQFEESDFVFGASGAAALLRREMLDEISILGEWFDEDFFAYREDVDLSWRAQILGWKARYAPKAVVWHVRRVLPERRRELPPELNLHSVRNRFLLRLKNETLAGLVRTFPWWAWRDLQVIGYVILRERSSVPGLLQVLRLTPRMLAKRREIMSRRRVSRAYLYSLVTWDASSLLRSLATLNVSKPASGRRKPEMGGRG